jgi:hypothetical protein
MDFASVLIEIFFHFAPTLLQLTKLFLQACAQPLPHPLQTRACHLIRRLLGYAYVRCAAVKVQWPPHL